MTRALAFRSGPRTPGFGDRLGRLRWRRAAGAAASIEWGSETRASSLSGAPAWVLVGDATAIPAGEVPEPPPGGLAVGRPGAWPPGAVAHTLRELEGTPLSAVDGPALAVAFRTADFPPAIDDDETIEILFKRLLGSDAARRGLGFPLMSFPDPSERERPEISRRLPAGKLRILDAGCGAGGLGLARGRNPAWEVVGIERDPLLAARARATCARVLEGDLVEALPRVAAGGERFDAVVFADVLEHLAEPVEALAQARRAVKPGGLLVVSVPNVGHLSIVRDLLLGRFDPVPSGLCDAGHLRWFTRESLREAIGEAGWRLETLEGEAGAPPPAPEAFARLADTWPDADRESLATYQWIATARG